MKKLAILLTAFMLFMNINSTQGQKRELNVAIFVHNGVELFDFAGPGEVFASANYFTDVVNFNVYTVAPTEEEVVSQTFLKINPNYSISNCPDPDIIVLPGGNTGIPMRNEAVMEWVSKTAESSEIMLSVCTGAFLLAKAGLLDGLRATTHHSSIDGLRKYDKITVLENTKFIDNDQIITSGGVSSGTEGSLHVISRVAGMATAAKVARYMEYDHWNEDIGVVDKKKHGLDKIAKLTASTSKETLIAQLENTNPIYYGELDKLGEQMLEEGNSELALRIFEVNADRYPSYTATMRIKSMYQQLGRSVPLTEDDFTSILDKDGFGSMVKSLRNEQKKFPEWKLFQSHSMYMLGVQYMNDENYEDAITAFEINKETFPESWYNYSKLGEIYAKLGKAKLAIKNYEKSLALNPDDEVAKETLASLK